ncbi:MAG: hypothetical protein U9R79_06985 [Armatimonadota bacterium]|nr:hypothetical protein [Armatimonadota bacterium]
MSAVHSEEKAFSYALVSAAPLQDTRATGIGIIFKADDRSTVRSICTAAEDTDRLTALYEGVLLVLDEALAGGVGRPAIYIDDEQVVAQLEGRAAVPRSVLAANLRARAIMNQVGRPRLIAATRSSRFSARRLAESAASPDTRGVRSPPRQLDLVSDDAPG